MFLAGCGGTSSVAVSGTVTLDGAPLPDGLVAFIPTGETSGRKVEAIIANGSFEIDEKQGLPVGTFLVEVWRLNASGHSDHEGGRREEASGAQVLPEQMISPNEEGVSTLTCETTAEGPNQFTFECAEPAN